MSNNQQEGSTTHFKMAEKKTPAINAPLLLMSASDGLNLNPALGSNLFMPVAPQQNENLSAEDVETDNFVGQNLPLNSGPTLGQNLFPTTSSSDVFDNISNHGLQSPENATTEVQGHFYHGQPTLSTSQVPVIPAASLSSVSHDQNIYRMQKGIRAPYPPTTAQSSSQEYLLHSADSIQSGNFEPTSLPLPANVRPTITNPTAGQIYEPVNYHWFYSLIIEKRKVWKPFSVIDSIRLEDSFRSNTVEEHIPTNGGRYDVDIKTRLRYPIYWDEDPSDVRRCSWFFKPEGDTKFMPYLETHASQLEDEYKSTIVSGIWHKKVELSDGHIVVFHSPSAMVQFKASDAIDEWGNVGNDSRPRIVKRGVTDMDEIEEGESSQVDHLIFVIHGIGSTCDLRFRNLVECVNDMRKISEQLIQSHFGRYFREGKIGRVEFLPIIWHAALHNDANGVDQQLKSITLKSIAKLRAFTNDTLLDILFYSSPKYCQKISDIVAKEMNRVYDLFLLRNPDFNGDVSVSGHSLGSLILFDLLSHQKAVNSKEKPPVQEISISQKTNESGLSRSSIPSNLVAYDDFKTDNLASVLDKLSLTDYKGIFEKEHIDIEALQMCDESDIKDLGLPMGPRKKILTYVKNLSKQRKNDKIAHTQINLNSREATPIPTSSNSKLDRSTSLIEYDLTSKGVGAPHVEYSQLSFSVVNMFALGSPVAMFLTVRGICNLGESFQLPTCIGYFNIFHPYDPVAYRLEPLVSSSPPPKPVLMPHHKGRKRLHLELKESMMRMGSDIKQQILSSVRKTWNTLAEFARSHRSSAVEMEKEVDSMLSSLNPTDENDTASLASTIVEEDILEGQLNQGRRIDYVLQEAPLESFNEYIFALGSHLCYWDSEDTILLFLKEIYSAFGIAPIKPGSRSSFQFFSSPYQNPEQTPLQPTSGSFSAQYGTSSASQTTLGNFSPSAPPLSGFIRR